MRNTSHVHAEEDEDIQAGCAGKANVAGLFVHLCTVGLFAIETVVG